MDDLAEIAGQQFYVEYGTAISPDKLQHLISSYIPDGIIQSMGLDKWVNAIMTVFRKVTRALINNFFIIFDSF